MQTIDQTGAAVGHTMRAAVCTAYGPPKSVRICAVPLPRVGDRDVLIRIAATTVSTADWRMRALAMPRGFKLVSRLAIGFEGPRQRVLGSELCGTIVAAGKDVTRFKTGDVVIGFPGVRLGCHAEYRAMREDGAIILKPAALTHLEAAAMCFAGTTALHFLRDKGKIQAGQRVLVIGASGSVGTAAVQIARHLGAEVSGVCSGANRELVLGLGARDVVDYTVDDYSRHDRQYDVIIDTVGVETFARARRALRADGRLLMVAADVPQMLRGLLTLPLRQKAIAGLTPERVQDMEYLARLAEMGAYRPVIDQVFSFVDIAAAHARVESGHKRGNTVVILDGAVT